MARAASFGALLFLLGWLPACTEQERAAPREAAAAECPDELVGARCIKACDLAVETLATSGLTFLLHSVSGTVTRMTSPEAFYSRSFLVSGRSISLSLPVEILSDLRADRQQPPICIPLSLPGGGDGVGQYYPAGSTFSTDREHRGMVAITAYVPAAGIVEGIFEFAAVMLTAGGANQPPGDPLVTSI
ncbi:MAG: hypothetical protein FJ125_07635, partial [Deltaproteobacteria bacterium]|nr:hypothetical protein [Deltaproteobacteria bacterium]